MLGEGRHRDADRIERELLAQGKSPAQARRATVLGRPIEHNQSSAETDKAKERTPWLAFDLVFRPPPTAHLAWAPDALLRIREVRGPGRIRGPWPLLRSGPVGAGMRPHMCVPWALKPVVEEDFPNWGSPACFRARGGWASPFLSCGGSCG